MGKYERVAFELLELAFGDRWVRDDSRVFSFGPAAGTGEVDGTIDGRVAVEVGVGTPKQVRASVLDLALHPFEGKLLVLVDTPGHSTERSETQAATILERLGWSSVVLRVTKESDPQTKAQHLLTEVSDYLNADHWSESAASSVL